MEKFTYTNANNQSVVIGSHEDYQLIAATGLTAMEIVPYTIQGYRQNGYTLTNTQLGTRIISIEFAVFGKTDADFYNKRLELSKVFNPLLGEGVLVYDNGVIQRAIDVQVTQTIDVGTSHKNNLKTFTIELTAYNPLWRDVAENALLLGDFTGGLTFPFEFDDTVTFASRGAVSNIVISGDVPSPIRAEFKGGADTPILTLSQTGEFIKVNIELQEDEELIITTDYGNKIVNKREADGSLTSANHLISNDSTFFSLPIGENTLTFSATAGDNVEVYIYWYNWYMGV